MLCSMKGASAGSKKRLYDPINRPPTQSSCMANGSPGRGADGASRGEEQSPLTLNSASRPDGSYVSWLLRKGLFLQTEKQCGHVILPLAPGRNFSLTR